jgi:hypothetical protein
MTENTAAELCKNRDAYLMKLATTMMSGKTTIVLRTDKENAPATKKLSAHLTFFCPHIFWQIAMYGGKLISREFTSLWCEMCRRIKLHYRPPSRRHCVTFFLQVREI